MKLQFFLHIISLILALIVLIFGIVGIVTGEVSGFRMTSLQVQRMFFTDVVVKVRGNGTHINEDVSNFSNWILVTVSSGLFLIVPISGMINRLSCTNECLPFGKDGGNSSFREVWYVIGLSLSQGISYASLYLAIKPVLYVDFITCMLGFAVIPWLRLTGPMFINYGRFWYTIILCAAMWALIVTAYVRSDMKLALTLPSMIICLILHVLDAIFIPIMFQHWQVLDESTYCCCKRKVKKSTYLNYKRKSAELYGLDQYTIATLIGSLNLFFATMALF